MGTAAGGMICPTPTPPGIRFDACRTMAGRTAPPGGDGRDSPDAVTVLKKRETFVYGWKPPRSKSRPPETFAKPDRARVSGFLQGFHLRKLPDDFG